MKNNRSAVQRLAASVAGAVAVLAVSAAVASANDFFKTPSENIVCEIDTGYAYCTIFSARREGKLDDRGRVTVTGRRSDTGEIDGMRTLRYGQSMRRGNITCRSRMSGLTCTVPSGRGFTATRTGFAVRR